LDATEEICATSGVQFLATPRAVVMQSRSTMYQKQQSRQPGKPTALPCPPYAPFSWTAVVGVRTGGEVDAVFTLSPHSVPQREDVPVRPTKIYRLHDGFFAASRPSVWM